MLPDLQLTGWCESFLPANAVLKETLALSPVSGDAGFREYFRINSAPGLIAVHAPPEHEDIPGFVEKALFFRGHNIAVPEVFAVDYRKGYMLLEDLGDTLLLQELNNDSVDSLYEQAECCLIRFQGLSKDGKLFPRYDEKKLLAEMQLFPEWFVEKLLGISITPEEGEMLGRVFGFLVGNALEQPQVVVHRDYHSRNLMLKPNGELGVIDFQDAVIGPICYDLVSLLRDCYIRWPAGYVSRRLENYHQRCIAEGLLAGDLGFEQFSQWFDLTGLQRHIKVLGIFARLWLRDGKQQYLKDLPLVLRYTLEQAESYAELSAFCHWFHERLMPAIEQQDWYQPWQAAGVET